jgi:hypothetical protein
MSDDFAAWLACNPEPRLADLVRQHGNYAAIPPEAWEKYLGAVTTWQRLRRERYSGEITQFARAFQQLRHDVASRAARNRRQSQRSKTS